MEVSEIYELLSKTMLPVAYQMFPEDEVPDLPILIYTMPYSRNFSADGRVYRKGSHVQIDLYTRKKEVETEKKVEEALSDYYWEKTEEYLDEEQCYRIMYEMEV
ncbi:hypothetical protein [Sellimonas catena]|uniref:DUF3168 domain-containing protein n=1 Tax=Sellimonas catena TaxID=2994035 RepID=A0A9W6CDD7_9FIRM|nr:hypothetical protein [Sellimonas catena]GLG90405.1 hypothetical protein Selli2_18320 [Sellimonas catena]